MSKLKYKKNIDQNRYESKAHRVLIKNFRFHSVKSTSIEGHTDLNKNLSEHFSTDNYSYLPNFPILITSDKVPWEICTLYLLAKIESDGKYEPRTIRGIADHLLDYLRFLEEEKLSYLHFPENNLLKVTYRYRSRLIEQMSYGEISPSAAKFRINAVVKFYKEIVDWKLIDPEQIKNTPFENTTKLISISSSHGARIPLKIMSHNLVIKVPKKQRDPEYINDGGDLRPLTTREQELMLTALKFSSREYQLMFYLALFTGARIQTIGTLRVKHIQRALDQYENLRLPIGHGTEIDTKYGKNMTLQIPGWLVKDMLIYSRSPEAQKRRQRSFYGDTDENYLFLSKNGIPYYTSRKEIIDKGRREDPKDNKGFGSLRITALQDGAALRQHIHAILMPRIKLENPEFQKFKFHDLRASFGMNLLESQLQIRGNDNITAALDYTQQRMGHSSKQTTLQYLNYKSRLEWRKTIQHEFESNLFMYINTSNPVSATYV